VEEKSENGLRTSANERSSRIYRLRAHLDLRVRGGRAAVFSGEQKKSRGPPLLPKGSSTTERKKKKKGVPREGRKGHTPRRAGGKNVYCVRKKKRLLLIGSYPHQASLPAEGGGREESGQLSYSFWTGKIRGGATRSPSRQGENKKIRDGEKRGDY